MSDSVNKSGTVISGHEEIAEMDHYVILQDGFVGRDGKNEFVQMDLRPLDGESEGDGLAISFSTDFMRYKGDYLPITLEKDEVKALLDYLTNVYKGL